MADMNDLIPPPAPGGDAALGQTPGASLSDAMDTGSPNGVMTGSPQDMTDAAQIQVTGAGPNVNPTPDGGNEATGGGEPDNKATPEEQHLYNQFVTKAKLFIHGTKTRGAVMKMLNQPGQKAYASIGRTAANIVQMIENTANAANPAPLPQSVILHGGIAVVKDLVNLGVRSGIFGKVQASQLPHLTQVAILEATKKYGEAMIASGQAPQAAAKNFVAQTMAADHATDPDAASQNTITNSISAGITKPPGATGGPIPGSAPAPSPPPIMPSVPPQSGA